MEVLIMSLSPRERRTLDSIEQGLVGSDPKLASLLATFTRLTAGEALPVGETIKAGWRAVTRPRSARRHPRGGGTWPCGRWRGMLPRQPLAVALVWLVTSIVLIAVALAMNHSGGQAGCAVWLPACARQAHAPYATRPPAVGQQPSIPG
jgi:Protein of unknown function (DUF3040)